jgi:hypothetical protein
MQMEFINESSLELRGNYIYDEDIEKLSLDIKNNAILNTINLSLNSFGVIGIEHLSNALSVNRTITSLNLGYNNLDDISVLDVYQMLYLLIIH